MAEMKELPKSTTLTEADSSSDNVEQGSTQNLANADDLLLQQLGYKQEFKREFTRWSTVSYAAAIMGVLGSVPATYSTPLAAGGPAAPVWTWFSGTFFSLTIALSVAELCSAYPTAGGMYFVTKYVVPDRHLPVAAWCVGWLNFLGQAAGVASVGYSVAQMLLAMVAMGSGYDEATSTFAYAPTAKETVGVAVAVLALQGVVCSFPTKWLHKSISWFTPVNIAASISICIALLVLTEDKNDASHVFSHLIDGSGYNSTGFSFLVGYLSVAWTMTDYDATIHISEETRKAAIRGPVAIIEAVLISGFLGTILCITFAFCAPDPSTLLASGLGNPAAQIFFNAKGRNAGLAMWFWVVLVQFLTGISAMLSNTRMAFGFARDHALPFSTFFKHVSPLTQTPLNAVWLVVIFCACLNLIALGSVETIFSIFNVCAPALDCSYMAVVALKLYYEKEMPPVQGPFSLGKYSKPINYIALAWVSVITVVLLFPPFRPVTALNMNYAVAVLAFIFVFALGWWFIRARKVYVGPRASGHRDN